MAAIDRLVLHEFTHPFRVTPGRVDHEEYVCAGGPGCTTGQASSPLDHATEEKMRIRRTRTFRSSTTGANSLEGESGERGGGAACTLPTGDDSGCHGFEYTYTHNM
jgi:hypothetical protein